MRLRGKKGLLNGIKSTAIFLLFYIVISFILSGIVYAAYSLGYINSNNFQFLSDVASLIPLSLGVIAYMIYRNKIKPARIPKVLGLLIDNGIYRYIGIGVAIFVVILLLEVSISLISQITGIQINTNVQNVLQGSPVWFLIFVAVIEPINEEILFRGFLVPRIGIFASALLFGMAHYTYYSTFGVEVIAAFIFGMIAGYVFRKKGSLYPGIVAHILVNTIAVISLIAI
jgi:membrane protease YdiL (CAAX protease family)